MAQLVFFGRFSDFEENRQIDLPAHIDTTDQLAAWLSKSSEQFAAQYHRPGTKVIVNHEMVHSNANITNTDEIAFMSPMSGG